MNSMEQMKDLAVRQMRAAADLYDTCEQMEKTLEKGWLLDLKNRRQMRAGKLKLTYGIMISQEELDTWKEIIKEYE